MTKLPETVEVETGATPTAAVIWLHGLGADGHDFEPVVPALRLPADLPVRFVFPHAPERPVTINMGTRMRAWYDIKQLGGGPEDDAGIRESQALVEALIERERTRGVEDRRIVLAGFSQGGAIVLHTGLRHSARLAGIMALSTYLPLASTVAAERHAMNADLPILMVHGSGDEMIPIARAQAAREKLEALGQKIEWRDYPMGHAVCPEEITEISAWLGRVLRA